MQRNSESDGTETEDVTARFRVDRKDSHSGVISVGSFKFVYAPFWGEWITVATDSTPEEVKEYLDRSFSKDAQLRDKTKKDGTRLLAYERLPRWGADEHVTVRTDYGSHERNLWDLYHAGEIPRCYTHVRVRRQDV
ncbi:MAG: hypothetical protein WC796_04380 [Candidatus Pacearchaeota archaeon]|jgi:hypothetical protein